MKDIQREKSYFFIFFNDAFKNYTIQQTTYILYA